MARDFRYTTHNTEPIRYLIRKQRMTHTKRKKLLDKAFPAVLYSENKHVNVKGNKSPFDGDMAYWSQRNSKLYDDETSKVLKRQNHACGHCGLKCTSDERVHLHHIDGNHNNWKAKNLLAVHESCHDYIHMSNGCKPARISGAECGESRTLGSCGSLIETKALLGL
jgi:RNA-directed DNA polymerase